MKRGIDEPQAMIEEALAEAENPNGKRVSAAASTGKTPPRLPKAQGPRASTRP